MSNDDLTISIENKIGQIILNRPATHNAINSKMWTQIPLAMKSLQVQGARAIVFSGQGESFASGADLDELKQLKTLKQAGKLWSTISDCLNFVSSFSIPTIAKIKGSCVGGGCLLAVACDLRYASDNSSFGIPIALLGIILDDQNLARLLTLVGLTKACEMIYLGELFTAQQAQQMSLINEVVALPELDSTVARVSKRIVNNSAATIEQTKCSFKRLLAKDNQKQDQSLVVNSYLSQEFSERIKQLLDK